MKKKKFIVILAVLILIAGVYTAKKYSQNNKIVLNSSNIEKKIDDKSVNSTNEDTKKDDSNTAKKDISNDIKDVDTSSLDAEDSISLASLKSQGKPFILEFSQENCAPCQMLHPVLERLHKKYGDKVVIKSVDLAKHQEFSNDFPIRVTPTLFYFNSDGTPFIFTKELSKKLNFVGYKDKVSEELIFSGTEGFMDYDVFSLLIEEMKNAK